VIDAASDRADPLGGHPSASVRRSAEYLLGVITMAAFFAAES